MKKEFLVTLGYLHQYDVPKVAFNTKDEAVQYIINNFIPAGSFTKTVLCTQIYLYPTEQKDYTIASIFEIDKFESI